ncbi:enoyl-CoA hydratase [Marinivivus vitaminiproducens]|uniref:enoyl-CoA hydratase n=1 Tax=Marinivivus vitaminiproducens TaxID=3035935 RepID=UPI0027A3A0DE|nr:enoyl-CoA hydratase [Geminicoccaceae bacterium SCSIO 64248]
MTEARALPTDDLVIRTDDQGVARLRLNRPKAFNSLSTALMTELQDELDAIAKDPTVRVVLLQGDRQAFCAGHDLKEMRSHSDRGFLGSLFQQCSRLMMTLPRLPQPVIARVDGIATAAGCQLVAACDLAFCSTEARFATSGVKYGLFCSTPMVALSRNVRRKPAMEMLLTGDFIGAERALAEGLVNLVAPPDDMDRAEADLLARILDKPPRVLALGKQAFYRQLGMPLAEAYAFTSEVIVNNALDADAREGLDAFANKRSPVWDDAPGRGPIPLKKPDDHD